VAARADGAGADVRPCGQRCSAERTCEL